VVRRRGDLLGRQPPTWLRMEEHFEQAMTRGLWILSRDSGPRHVIGRAGAAAAEITWTLAIAPGNVTARSPCPERLRGHGLPLRVCGPVERRAFAWFAAFCRSLVMVPAFTFGGTRHGF